MFEVRHPFRAYGPITERFMLIVCWYFVAHTTTQNWVGRKNRKSEFCFTSSRLDWSFGFAIKWRRVAELCARSHNLELNDFLSSLWTDPIQLPPIPPPQLQQRKFSIPVSFYSQLIIFTAIVKPGAWKPPRVRRVADVNERSHLKAALWCQRQRHRLRRRYSAALLRRFKSSALLLSSLSSAHVAAASTGVAHLFQRLLRQQLRRVSPSWAKSSLQGEKGKIVVQGFFFFFLSDYCRKCVQPVTLTFRANRGTRCWQ